MSAADEGVRSRGMARMLRWAVAVRADEVRALLWAAAAFFSVLAGWYLVRPVRDEAGVAGGAENLPWLFTGTLIVTLAVHPVFAALVARLPRARAVAVTYHALAASLLLFWGLLASTSGTAQIWTGRAFFIWSTVLTLTFTAGFWTLMADCFTSEQGRRLFAFVSVGGTLGAIVGSAAASALAPVTGPAPLLLAAVVLFELAVLAVSRLSAAAPPRPDAAAGERERPVGGSSVEGLVRVARSPYLLAICLYMLLLTVTATFVYLQQAAIVETAFTDRGLRTAFFARIDLAVNVVTILLQVFVTGRLMQALGVTTVLAALPVLLVAGFGGLAAAPSVTMLAAVQIARRAGNFAFARPAREVLYTVLGRAERFKAKHAIDTFVYRFGDQVGAWSYAAMGVFGLGVAGVALVAVPLSAVWAALAVWLGGRQRRLAEHSPVATGREAPAESTS